VIKKNTTFNDPIYGFITIPHPFLHELINHPYFQRLQRIRQLALTGMVYPGATHTRFHHAMGAMHLTHQAIGVLRTKGVAISQEEELGVLVAILLHDIGHGPFSHALEHSIVHGVSHEDISDMFFQRLNNDFKGKLTLAQKIFNNTYQKSFLHQLVSGQLDMDRLDYLNRDSFFTGVSEGVIGSDRIIRMLNVTKDRLVVDAKGVYSIEKFIIARRLMYWQVYLHKTVLSAEYLLVNILKRANELAGKKVDLFCTPALHTFLYHSYGKRHFIENKKLLDSFAELDDSDIYASVKTWVHHSDFILSALSYNLVNRTLYKVLVQDQPFSIKKINQLKKKADKKYRLTGEESNYFVFTHSETNDAYRPDKIRINILSKNGKISDIAGASDQSYLSGLKTVKKYFLCFPKELK
jgi:HD superfamily phosphohydrolase